jgi:two-component system, sensor histidine kinase and response regulator
MSTRPHIIYVDDEQDNLVAFKANFRLDYEVFITTNVSEAADYLRHNEVKVVFSDQMMPDITGVEFFETIRPDYPDVVRVLITGHADMHAVIDAINRGEIYRYITKPWDNFELKVCIENCVEKYDRDVELKQKNAELEKALTELEKFVYSASHDLRAPITTIKGVLNMARIEKNWAKSEQYLEMIERSADKLNGFVTNIIHYYQNMKNDEILEETTLESLVDEVLERYSHFEQSKKIKYTKQINQSSPFKADIHRLRMVLNNVVSNAIRFRNQNIDNSEVSIEVLANKEKAIIKISDNGIGIEPQLLPTIFEMFTKSDADKAGVGVGLYIAREAVKKLGGNISLISEVGNGTKCIVEVPNKA